MRAERGFVLSFRLLSMFRPSGDTMYLPEISFYIRLSASHHGRNAKSFTSKTGHN